MVFSSIPFLFYFFPLFLILYRVVPDKFKNGIILIFSLFFYAWGEPIYVFLMILETLSDFLIGLSMEKCGEKSKKKRLLILSLIVDLGILGFFKYADFVIDTINSLFNANIANIDLALPIGISFFTFQSLSYVIDLYREEITAEHSYADYLTYISMFPQLVAGPIVRFATIREELHQNRIKENWFSENFVPGFERFLQGLFKKVLLANQIGALFNEIDALSDSSVLTLWLGAIAFTFQIYFDFSGYSDMAIGMGKMMGFTFLENFRHPLLSDSITDFWRKWHISLSTWFKSYVYISLGGNRVGKIKLIRNIMIVWLLTGLWHGASWNFVIWGAYFGIILLFEKLIYGKYLDKLPLFVRRIYSFVLVCIGFVIFSHDSMDTMLPYLAGMIGLNNTPFFSSDLLWYLKENLLIIIICFIFARPLPDFITLSLEKSQKAWGIGRLIVYTCLFLLSVACIVNDSYNPFLYFRF